MKTLSLLLLLVVFSWPALAADLSATLSWDANTEPDLAGYNVYRSTVPGQYGTPLQRNVLPPLILYQPQLEVDTTYYFTLTAYDVDGNESKKSAEGSKLIHGVPRIVVGTPALTIAVQSSSELAVDWVQMATGVKVDVRYFAGSMNWGSATPVDCPASPCTLSGLEPGTYYEVMAISYVGTLDVDAQFGSFSAIVSATTKQAIKPPTGLVISKSTGSEVIITASRMDCARVKTSSAGSNSKAWRRTLRCEP